MVEPERETPGISAPTWARPTIKASRRRIWSTLRRWRQTISEIASKTAMTMQDQPITVRLRKADTG